MVGTGVAAGVSYVTGAFGRAGAITPADTDLDRITRGLYIGGTGDVVVQMANGDDPVTFKAVPVATILPIAVRQVRAATTATLIVGLY